MKKFFLEKMGSDLGQICLQKFFNSQMKKKLEFLLTLISVHSPVYYYFTMQTINMNPQKRITKQEQNHKF